ncbi:MAG: hypothetical protein ACI4KF_03365 [Huintestinicola sp.]
MNMKKSIAGVMAGAMAVSAMAATVSAQDQIALTYDLSKYVKAVSAAKATVTETYANDVFTVSDAVGDELNANGVSFLEVGIINTFVQGDAYATIDPAQMIAVEFTATTRKEVNDPKKIIATGTDTLTTTIKFTGDKSATDGSHYHDMLNKDWNPTTIFNLPLTTNKDETDMFNMAAYKDVDLGYTVNANGKAVEDNDYSFSAAVIKMTYKLDGEYLATPVTDHLGALEILHGSQDFYALTDSDIFIGEGIGKPAIERPGDTYMFNWTTYTMGTHYIVGTPVYAVTNFTPSEYEEQEFPFKTMLKPEYDTAEDTVTPNDVVAALTARKAGDNYYTKPIAVINDAIANHENVVFTFTSFDGYVATKETVLYSTWATAGRAYGWQVNKYDWYNPYFGQHLYTNIDPSYSLFGTDDYDMYGSYSIAWGINLFTGAVVINNALTMQLSDTDKFDWGNNTLSFDWNSITAEGKITDAKTLMTSMLMYTPVDWYWKTLSVVVGDEEGDDVSSTAGEDGNGTEIDDEDVVITVDDEDEEPVVVEEPAEEPAKEIPTSPATGNSPVALAVIPVALAAAAVVAKKRG